MRIRTGFGKGRWCMLPSCADLAHLHLALWGICCCLSWVSAAELCGWSLRWKPEPELAALAVETRPIQCTDSWSSVSYRKVAVCFCDSPSLDLKRYIHLLLFHIHVSVVCMFSSVWANPPKKAFIEHFDLGDWYFLWSVAGLHNIWNPAFFYLIPREA